MSGLLEFVAVAAGLESDWAAAGDAIGNGSPNCRSNQNWGSHTEFTVAQAGIKGVARRSLSAWRDKSADPRRTPDGLPARTCARINLNEVRNETLSVATVALVLAVAANLAPPVAQGPKTSGGNGWPGISQPRITSTNTVTTTMEYGEAIGFSSGNP